MKAGVLNVKLSFFCHLLSSLFIHRSIATETFKTLASVDVYNLVIIQQCLYLDSELSTNAVAHMLNNPDNAKCLSRSFKASLLTAYRELILKEASSHLFVSLASVKIFHCCAFLHLSPD